jgi:hypothetical protein
MVRFGFASCGKQVPYSLLGGQGKVTFTNGTRPDFKALPRRFMMSRQAAMRIPTRSHENPDKQRGTHSIRLCTVEQVSRANHGCIMPWNAHASFGRGLSGLSHSLFGAAERLHSLCRANEVHKRVMRE